MDFYKDFTATKLKRKNIFSFSLTVFLVAGIVVLTSTVSITYGQVGNTKTGVFNHTQTDSSGNITWINSGNWSMTGINSSSPSFTAIIDMAKPNGSAGHEHEISDFELIGSPVIENQTIHLNGISTITMRDGPATNEPTVIALSQEEIDIYFDPENINNHFENQSISGIGN
ncbi:hypothetical protein [Candidatus Nitrosocosmicus arcticus]|uniref:Uncharacterized protein n=1 Tax=Candidatus Nitrosocosmicus arcticus TaxID=2035267 RepID=A0A557SWC7_9ARCH|nr:hypothetical protein [Candidatus Nitrosocosmicus arcticus]TVP40917.1 hypothetical protein NARC_50098 [Candidatus Nitrosocosmicus arcticus]